MTKHPKRPSPRALPGARAEDLFALVVWLEARRRVFLTGERRCKEAYKISGVESLANNAAYYRNAASGLMFVIKQLRKVATARLAQEAGPPNAAG